MNWRPLSRHCLTFLGVFLPGWSCIATGPAQTFGGYVTDHERLVGCGEAQTLEGARHRALADIGVQLRATIASRTMSVIGESIADGQASVVERREQTVVVASSFDYPELTVLLGAAAVGGGYRACVGMERRAATGRLSVRQQELEVDLARLLAAAKADDASVHARNLDAVSQELSDIIVLIGAISGRALPRVGVLSDYTEWREALSHQGPRTAVRLCVSWMAQQGSAGVDAESLVENAVLPWTRSVVPCSSDSTRWVLNARVAVRPLVSAALDGVVFCDANVTAALEDPAGRVRWTYAGAEHRRTKSTGRTPDEACSSALQIATDMMREELPGHF